MPMERPRSLEGEKRGRRAPRLRQAPLAKDERDGRIAAILNKGVIEAQHTDKQGQEGAPEISENLKNDEKGTE